MSDYAFLDCTDATASSPHSRPGFPLKRSKQTPDVAEKPTQQADIDTINQAAQDALSMHSSLVKLHGDLQTYEEYFKDTESHNAVKLISKLNHDWLKAFLARELANHGPRAQVEIIKTSGIDESFTSVDPAQHKFYFGSKFFNGGSKVVDGARPDNETPGLDTVRYERGKSFIHELSHYVSYHKYNEFLNLTGPACQKLSRSLKLDHIVDIELIQRNPKSKTTTLSAVFGRRRSGEHQASNPTKQPPSSTAIEFGIHHLTSPEQRAWHLPWKKAFSYRRKPIHGPEAVRELLTYPNGHSAALLNADNYASYIAAVAAKHWRLQTEAENQFPQADKATSNTTASRTVQAQSEADEEPEIMSL